MTPEKHVLVLELRIEIPVTLELPDSSRLPPNEPPSRDDQRAEARKWDPPYPSAR